MPKSRIFTAPVASSIMTFAPYECAEEGWLKHLEQLEAKSAR
jgi:hypothetical protein